MPGVGEVTLHFEFDIGDFVRVKAHKHLGMKRIFGVVQERGYSESGRQRALYRYWVRCHAVTPEGNPIQYDLTIFEESELEPFDPGVP